MRGPHISLVVSLSLLGLASCGSKKDRVLASTKTAVSADLVHRTGDQWTDRGKVRLDAVFVVVHSSPEASLWTSCSATDHKNPSLTLDEKAERVAYRCGPGMGWHVFDLRRMHKEPPFRRCAEVVTDSLDWRAVPRFEEARVSLLSCSASDGPAGMAQSFKSIVAESRARGGTGEVANLLGQSLMVRVGGVVDADGTDDWDRTWMDLSARDKSMLTSSFRAALETGTEVTAMRRALLHGNLDDAQLLDAMDRAGRKLATAAIAKEDVDEARERRSALEVIVRTLLTKRPSAAADIACDAASRFAANGQSRVVPREQLAAIASAKKVCTLDGVFDRSTCNASFGCCAKGFLCADASRRPCTSADLDALVKLEASRPPRNPWPAAAGGGAGDELLVAAAMAQGSTPAAASFLERMKKVPTCKP